MVATATPHKKVLALGRRYIDLINHHASAGHKAGSFLIRCEVKVVLRPLFGPLLFVIVIVPTHSKCLNDILVFSAGWVLISPARETDTFALGEEYPSHAGTSSPPTGSLGQFCIALIQDVRTEARTCLCLTSWKQVRPMVSVDESSRRGGGLAERRRLKTLKRKRKTCSFAVGSELPVGL